MTQILFIIIIISLPLQFALNVGENVDLVTTRILVPVLFLLWLARSLARKKLWIPNKAEMWLTISFLFLSALSLYLGRDASVGFRKLLYFFTIIPVFFVAADLFREQKWRERAIAAIVFGGTIAAAVGIFQFLFSFLIGIDKSIKIWENLAPFFLGNSFGKIVAANSSWLVNVGGETRMRAFGLFPDPHNFAFFVNLCLFAGLGYLFSRKKKSLSLRGSFATAAIPCDAVKHEIASPPKADRNDKGGVNLLIGISVILMILAIGLSFSRGAYLGLIAGGLFFAVIFLKRSGVFGKALMAVVAIFIIIFIFNSNIISQRLISSFNLKEGSNAERYKNWTQAAEMIKDYPLGGVGLGNYARAVDPIAADRSSIYAHNLFLDIAAETGVLNAIIFFILIFVSVWRNIKNNNMISLGLASGLVAFLVHSIFDTALYSPQVLTLFLIIIALGLYNLKTQMPNLQLKTQKYLILSVLLLLPVYLIKIKFGWLSFNVLELLIAILFILWIFNKNTKYQILNTKYLLPASLIFIGLMLSVIANGNYYTGLGVIKGWFVVPIIFAIIFLDALKKDESLLRKSLLALFFSGVVVSAIGIAYKFLGILTYDGRLKIFWDSPNQMAMFLAIPFLIGSIFALQEKEAKTKRLYSLSTPLIGLSLYFSYSYGAWLAIVVAIIAMLWLKYSKIKQKKYLVIFAIILLVLLAWASIYKYKAIANMGERSSLSSRFMIWKSAGLIIENNPLFGIGPGNFQEKYLEYQKYFPPYLEWSAPQPHNIFLAFWLESGLIGLVGFIILLIYFFRSNKKAIKNDRDLGILLLGIMIYILVHGLIDTTYWRNDLAVVFWVVVAMNIYLSKQSAKIN